MRIKTSGGGSSSVARVNDPSTIDADGHEFDKEKD
jgi:hypothetical protein